MFTSSIFFFNDTATTEIYTLSLHGALPISRRGAGRLRRDGPGQGGGGRGGVRAGPALGGERRGGAATPRGGRRGGGAAGDGEGEKTRLDFRSPIYRMASFCFKKKTEH